MSLIVTYHYKIQLQIYEFNYKGNSGLYLVILYGTSMLKYIYIYI